ncbi:MAG: DNA repair protein RecO [Bacilli bacterium]|jgi:DNA repair protein RecO (recombination protein O)|nr:DNA repair protein RecO [Bacilli bacterium]
MITKVEGFIMNEVNYGESSKVINILTKEYGLIGVMCKGAKSMKSRLRAVTMRFTYGFFYLYYKEGKLSLLKDVDVIDSFPLLHSDIVLLGFLNYITELTQQVFKECGDASLFSFMLITIQKLNAGLDPFVLTNILEIKYLDYLGVGLNLDACIRCGRQEEIVTIDPDDGGYLCIHCVQGEKIVSLKTVKMLRMYYYVDLDSISSLNISEEVKQEINSFLTRYYDRYTGLYLKSKDFLKKLESF